MQLNEIHKYKRICAPRVKNAMTNSMFAKYNIRTKNKITLRWHRKI